MTIDDILACLELEPLADDRFTAPNFGVDYRRIFGGQSLAQCIAVASASAPEKRVKSIHVVFPREGDVDSRIEYVVDRLSDGRTFAARRVTGVQGGRPIVAATVSLDVDEPGLSHQTPAPDVGPPEDASPVALSMIPWETRAVAGVDLAARDVGPPEYALWMRAPALPDAAGVHRALLAHATDLTLIGTTLRPHAGLSEADSPERLQTAVTTHWVSFHRPFRLDEWLLLVQESPSLHGARGFGSGHVFDRRLDLVASFAQESMIRVVAASPR